MPAVATAAVVLEDVAQAPGVNRPGPWPCCRYAPRCAELAVVRVIWRDGEPDWFLCGGHVRPERLQSAALAMVEP